METKGNDRANITLQLALAGALLLLLYMLLFSVVNARIPERNDAAFNILLGNVMGWIGALVAFSFPSNIGNAKKDDTIRNLSASASAPLTETTTRTLESDHDGRKGQTVSEPTVRGGDEVGGGAGTVEYQPEPISPGQWEPGTTNPPVATGLPNLPPGKRDPSPGVG